jgi:hypothetical protein
MIIPDSTTFDQRTMTLLMEHDPVVQRYQAFFALFDWALPHIKCACLLPDKERHCEGFWKGDLRTGSWRRWYKRAGYLLQRCD